MEFSVSNIVQTLRTKNNITQEELGQKVGVTRQTIISIEKGQYIPSLLLALRIAKFFHKPVESIFDICKK